MIQLGPRRALIYDAEGPMLRTEADANDFIGEAWRAEADMVVIPASRIGDAFFQLRTRVAGEIVQKFVNYRLHLVVLGDISSWTRESQALRDYIEESNRGRALWFMRDVAELEAAAQRL